MDFIKVRIRRNEILKQLNSVFLLLALICQRIVFSEAELTFRVDEGKLFFALKGG